MEHLGLYFNDWLGPLLAMKLIGLGFAVWLGQEIWLRTKRKRRQ